MNIYTYMYMMQVHLAATRYNENLSRHAILFFITFDAVFEITKEKEIVSKLTYTSH